MGDIERRKDHHLDLCLQEDVGSAGVSTGLGGYRLEFDALPEIDLDDVDVSVELLGRRLKAPILVGAMTGGTDRAKDVNQTLARAAQRVGVGMALGSQRAMLVDPSCSPSFDVRKAAPDLPLLFGNVGAVQLNYGVDNAAIKTMVESVGADALNLHINPLQEAIQPEGDTRFSNLAPKIEALCESLDIPVLAKEVGSGFSAKTANKLAKLKLAGIETAGVGGTSWAKVESFRAPKDSLQAEVGRRLAGFGVSTAESVQHCRNAFGERVVIASGGMRTGYDVAVAVALGADAGALARPLLEAATVSEDAAVLALETLIYELRVVCFCTGAKSISELRSVQLFGPGRFSPSL